MDRWATFDCYGTLIDWNGGIGRRARAAVRRRARRAAAAPLPRDRAGDRARAARARRIARSSTVALTGSPSARALALAADERDALSRARCRRGSRSPRCATRSRMRARAAGSSRSSRTPTATTSRRRWSRSASRSSSRSSPSEIGSYKPAHRTGRRSTSRRARRAGARARRGEPVPRRRAGDRARSADGVDQPARRAAQAASGRRAAHARRSRRSARLARLRVAARVRPLRRGDRRRLPGARRALLRRGRAALSAGRRRSASTRCASGCSRVELADDSWLLRGGRAAVAVGWSRASRRALRMDVGHRSPGCEGAADWAASSSTRSEDWARRKALRASSWTSRTGRDDAGASSCARAAIAKCGRFYEMAIELDGSPVAPELPDGIAIEPFDRAGRARVPRRDQRGVPGSLGASRRWRSRSGGSGAATSPNLDPSLWFLIRDGDEVAGGRARRAPNRNGGGYVGALGVRRPWRRRGLGEALLLHAFARVYRRGLTARHARRRRGEPDRRDAAIRACRHAGRERGRRLREDAPRERCCARSARRATTLTAVAIGPEYECHSCGRTFAAGLVRVPRAWGDGGELMIEAASLPLDYPGGAVVEEDTLHAQNTRLASDLPVRPLILGGCCCSHIGAVEGLAARHDRLGVIWFDAHGDLNTPETSPSGNEWGMPLRMMIDGGAVSARGRRARRCAQPRPARGRVHRGSRDPRRSERGARPRRLRLRRARLRRLRAERDGGRACRSRAGPRSTELERAARPDPRERGAVVGAGLTGLAPEPANVEKLERLTPALGFWSRNPRPRGRV